MASENPAHREHKRVPKKTTFDAMMEDLYIKAACTHFIVTGNKTEAYSVYVNALKDPSGSMRRNANSAFHFFKRPQVIDTLAALEKSFVSRQMGKYISSPDFKGSSKSASFALEDVDVSYDYVTASLKEVADTAETDTGKIQALKAIADVAALKKPQEKSDGSELIHYFLPAKVCDSCPNRSEIYTKYEDEEALLEMAKSTKERGMSAEEMDMIMTEMFNSTKEDGVQDEPMEEDEQVF